MWQNLKCVQIPDGRSQGMRQLGYRQKDNIKMNMQTGLPDGSE